MVTMGFMGAFTTYNTFSYEAVEDPGEEWPSGQLARNSLIAWLTSPGASSWM